MNPRRQRIEVEEDDFDYTCKSGGPFLPRWFHRLIAWLLRREG